MKTRIITAGVALCLFFPVLYFSDTVVFAIAVSLFCAVAVWEIARCFGLHKKFFAYIPAYIIAAGAPIIAFFYKEQFFSILFISAFIYLFYTFTFSVFAGDSFKISDAMMIFAYVFYVIVGFSSMILLRANYPDLSGQHTLLLIFFGAWFTDTGAYFIGVFFGRHKLIPKVSPKKTVEGALGGILGCIVGYLVFGLIVKLCFNGSPNFSVLIIGAMLVAIVSQIGDLIASAVKRTQNIKDYGVIFPGHGGILDRFDSAIAVAPFVYFLTELSVRFF